jgi:hypothetical protein
MAVSKDDLAKLKEMAEWNRKHGDPSVANNMDAVADTVERQQKEDAAEADD